MNTGNHRFSAKSPFLRIGCLLLLLCLALSSCQKAAEETPAGAAGAAAAPAPEPVREPTAWDTAFETGNGSLEETSLVPENYSGFTIGFVPGMEHPLFAVGDPVRTDENGVRWFALTEEQAEKFFVYPQYMSYADGTATYSASDKNKNPHPVAVGPDGTVLWLGKVIVTEDGRYDNAFFIQRGRELLIIDISDTRGVPDDDSWLYRSVSGVMSGKRQYGAFEWSPDSRYVFLNNMEQWQEISDGWMELPYLLDTRTGEIFLIYSLSGLNQKSPLPNLVGRTGGDQARYQQRAASVISCGTWDAHFSRDGRSLYLILYGVNLPDWESGKAFMRYDLASGAMERCCWLPEDACAFRETGDGRFLVCCPSAGWQVLTAGDSGYTVAATGQPGIYGLEILRFHEGLYGSAALLEYNDRATTAALAVVRDDTEKVDEWYLMTDVNGGFEKVGTEELKNRFAERTEDTVRIEEIIPVRETPYAILCVWGSSVAADLWKTVYRTDIRILLLDTDTMTVKPLGGTLSKLHDSHNDSVTGNILIDNRKSYSLNTDLPAEDQKDPRTESWHRWVQEPINESTHSIHGSLFYYGINKADDQLVCNNDSYSKTTGFRFIGDILVRADSYRVTVCLELNQVREPQYLIPPVLTGERYQEVIIGNGISEEYYERVAPEDLPEREDREKLISRYPSVTGQPLYILISNERNSRRLAQDLEGIYTREDYEQDIQLMSRDYLLSISEFSLRYTFSAENPDIVWTSGPAAALCTLADQLGSAVYYRYASADPKPESVESLSLGGRYVFDYIPYQVSLDSVEEEDNRLTVVFTAVPEDEYGMFPVKSGDETTDEGGVSE